MPSNTISFSVIVPARRASTRLPDKPLADINGIPMLVRVLEQAAAAGANNVIAAVDDDEIAAVVGKHNFQWQMTGDCDSGSVRVALAARNLQNDLQLCDDAIIVNVQGDEPFIEPEIIYGVAKLLADSPHCVCATAARPPRSTEEFYAPSAVKVVLDNNNCATYFSRSPIPHVRADTKAIPKSALIHIGIYAYTMKFLQQLPTLSPAPAEQDEQLEQLRILWHQQHIAVLCCDSQSFGIDTADDLQKAQHFAS